MSKVIKATALYGTKKLFQAAGENAWVTYEMKNHKGETEEKQTSLKDFLTSENVVLEIRNGTPSPCNNGESKDAKKSGDPLNLNPGERQPSWMARAFRDGQSIRIS